MTPEWTPAPGCRESLAIALRAVLAQPDAAELEAVLGLGGAIVAGDGEPPRVWHMLARDVNLAATAALYGLRLRALHPRGAARGLSSSAEFAAHFHDSYLPLIERALAAGQVALVWRGWPPPAADDWGLITRVEAGAPVGRSSSLAAPAPLVGPAHQVYLVEERFTVSAPDAPRLLRAAWRATHAFWEPADAADAVGRGAAAWRAWSAAPMEEIREGILALAVSRGRLADWLGRIAPQLDASVCRTASEWRAIARAASERLQPLAQAWCTDRSEWIEALRAVATMEGDWSAQAGPLDE